MKNIVVLMRVILFYMVYLETGIFTTIAMVLIFISVEGAAYVAKTNAEMSMLIAKKLGEKV